MYKLYYFTTAGLRSTRCLSVNTHYCLSGSNLPFNKDNPVHNIGCSHFQNKYQNIVYVGSCLHLCSRQYALSPSFYRGLDRSLFIVVLSWGWRAKPFSKLGWALSHIPPCFGGLILLSWFHCFPDLVRPRLLRCSIRTGTQHTNQLPPVSPHLLASRSPATNVARKKQGRADATPAPRKS